ncbi:MAG: exodeoxyribonuclease VII large subunit [Sphingobacteriaceae bacterium]|nr:exodeoxyribonuclease VII large subunit [Sphingobacteriaceae bacterium]
MPEIVNDKQVFSLLEVTKSIQKTLSDRYKSSFWVKAEMNKLNFYKQSGHCYPELVEKKDGKVIAQIKSNLWKGDFNRVNNNFQTTLKEPLKDGIKILFQAKISFDPSHGLSLQIIDIDPSYTLGDLEREKQETIKQLREEGIFNKNKTLKLPLLPQRIAIISVETSKGYVDFLKVIETNSWKYKFFHLLFPSLLQGEKAVQGIIAQLKMIKKVKSHFDVVAIIRGGGGDVGLSCYNNYELAKEIALFPIPVITGIGHATNETVSEMISFSNAITPTELADYLLQKFHNFSVPVKEAEKKVIDKSRRLLSEENAKFQSEVKLFRSVTENILITNRNKVKNATSSLLQHAQFIFKNQNEYLRTVKANFVKETNVFCNNRKQEIINFAITIRKDTHSQLNQFKFIVSQLMVKLLSQSGFKFKSSLLELNNIEKNIANMSPANVLKRGYSITLLNGKAVKTIAQVKSGDLITTTVFEGEIISVINSTNKTTNQ